MNLPRSTTGLEGSQACKSLALLADAGPVGSLHKARAVAILFDLGHPAHFHLFKNAIVHLRQAGHHVELVARQKDCLQDLLADAGWSFHLAPRAGGKLTGLARQTAKAMAITTSFGLRGRTDLMVGTSVVIGPASRLTGAISVVFGEDDAQAVPWFARLAYPAAHYIATPRCLQFENHGRKHLTYPGYQELAYLHPNRYRPNSNVRKLLALKPAERYFLVRLVALTAHHDIGQKGITAEQARTLIERLSAHGRVFISAERGVEPSLRQYLLPTPPERIFDVMAFADMVIGDSQTMAAEAAVLGTPALRCNTFVGRLTYLEELEHKYGLTVGIKPEHFDRLLRQVDTWLVRPNLKAQWQEKRQAMLADCVDLTNWIIELLTRLDRKASTAAGRYLPPRTHSSRRASV